MSSHLGLNLVKDLEKTITFAKTLSPADTLLDDK